MIKSLFRVDILDRLLFIDFNFFNLKHVTLKFEGTWCQKWHKL